MIKFSLRATKERCSKTAKTKPKLLFSSCGKNCRFYDTKRYKKQAQNDAGFKILKPCIGGFLLQQKRKHCNLVKIRSIKFVEKLKKLGR